MVQADPSGDPRRDPYRPIRAGGDDPVDPPRAGEPVDPLLVLGREHRALVGEREARSARIAVDGDHVDVAAHPSRLEQAELGRPCA